MAKIILTAGDTVLQEMVLSKERITIGRRSHNDIVLDNIAISGEHAVIVTILNDSYLEDLNSTNGTQINGQPIKKHYLRDDDVIELAQYRIRYVSDARPGTATDSVLHAPSGDEESPTTCGISTALQNVATIKVLNGVNAGKEIALTKVLTTIGRPGVQVAVITKRLQGYCVTHVEGDCYPIVNGQSVGAGEHPLTHGDVIDLSGTQMAFSLL